SRELRTPAAIELPVPFRGGLLQRLPSRLQFLPIRLRSRYPPGLPPGSSGCPFSIHPGYLLISLTETACPRCDNTSSDVVGDGLHAGLDGTATGRAGIWRGSGTARPGGERLPGGARPHQDAP